MILSLSNVTCKRLISIAVYAALVLVLINAGAKGRSIIELDSGWKFHRGDIEAGEEVGLDITG